MRARDGMCAAVNNSSTGHCVDMCKPGRAAPSARSVHRGLCCRCRGVGLKTRINMGYSHASYSREPQSERGAFSKAPAHAHTLTFSLKNLRLFLALTPSVRRRSNGIPEACFTLARPSTPTHAFSIAGARYPTTKTNFFLSLPPPRNRFLRLGAHPCPSLRMPCPFVKHGLYMPQ